MNLTHDIYEFILNSSRGDRSYGRAFVSCGHARWSWSQSFPSDQSNEIKALKLDAAPKPVSSRKTTKTSYARLLYQAI